MFHSWQHILNDDFILISGDGFLPLMRRRVILNHIVTTHVETKRRMHKLLVFIDIKTYNYTCQISLEISFVTLKRAEVRSAAQWPGWLERQSESVTAVGHQGLLCATLQPNLTKNMSGRDFFFLIIIPDWGASVTAANICSELVWQGLTGAEPIWEEWKITCHGCLSFWSLSQSIHKQITALLMIVKNNF